MGDEKISVVKGDHLLVGLTISNCLQAINWLPYQYEPERKTKVIITCLKDSRCMQNLRQE